MATLLYDAFGYPLTSSGGGRLINATRSDSQARPAWETRLEPIHRSIGFQDWRILTSASRRLTNNFPILEGAMDAKAMHAVGRAWTPVFLGDDQDWGMQAKSWLEDEWFKICDVEGENFDWRTGLFLNSKAIDGDGDFGVIFTQTASGYPKLQHVAADRIGQRNWSSKTVGPGDAWSSVDDGSGNFTKVKGVYAGLRIELGVIFTPMGYPVACRILGGLPEEDQDVSLRDMILRFDPRCRGQKRGLSAFAGAIEFLASSFEAHDGELRALLASSFLPLIEYNSEGGFDPTDEANSGRTTEQTQLQTWEKGMIKYFKAGSGQKLEIPVSQRPSEQWDSLNDRILRIALSPVWPYSLCWKPDQMNGTQERSAIELARALVVDRQDLLFPVAKREVAWATSKAVKLGILPPYRGKDAGKGGQLKWGFEMPPEFNIDHGREDQQERENYKIGFSTLRRYLDKNARGTVADHWYERAQEQAIKQQQIARVEQEYGVTIDPREVQMFGPNDQAQTDPAEDPEDAAPAK